MERIAVIKSVVGVCHMQVCAEQNATDEEILAVCNRENPSGTSNGWSRVIREGKPPSAVWPTERLLPVACGKYPDRKHFIVSC